MSIIIGENTKVIVQGITGREGQARTKLMLEYGTKIVAGCTPGKGGQEVLGVSVYNSVKEVIEKHGEIDATVIFVPAPVVKNAAIEAFTSGVKLAVIVPDRVPIFDVLEIAHHAKKNNARFIGPNTLGILSVNKAIMGMIGGRAKSAKSWFKPGPVGVCSRSGGITSSMAYYLNKEGIGQTTIMHVGGDSIVGTPLPDACRFFEQDPETKVVVMFGEIGTSQEEEVARMMKEGEFTKPLVCFIGGKAAKKGTRFSHAGAIVEGNKGTWQGKVQALEDAGAIVCREFDEIPIKTKEVLSKL